MVNVACLTVLSALQGKLHRSFRAWKSFKLKSVRDKSLRSKACNHHNKTLQRKAVQAWKGYIHLCFRIKVSDLDRLFSPYSVCACSRAVEFLFTHVVVWVMQALLVDILGCPSSRVLSPRGKRLQTNSKWWMTFCDLSWRFSCLPVFFNDCLKFKFEVGKYLNGNQLPCQKIKQKSWLEEEWVTSFSLSDSWKTKHVDS